MNYNTCTLPNGLRVIHRHDASPVVFCGYGINVGARDEAANEEGLAHFCEHVTFKGTSHRKAWHVLNSLERVGGDLNAFTNKEDTVYYAAILRDHLPRAVDLLSDIVFHSIYPQGEIEKEAEVIADEIESYNDSPAELIYDEFENMVFKGHPLGHNILGNTQRLRQFGTGDALRFTHRFYVPQNMVFFAYGDIRFDRLVRLLEKATGDFPAAEPLVPDLTVEPASLPPLVGQQTEIPRGTHQAHVMLGNRAYGIHSDKRMALYLLNNILGGPGMNARLSLSLRERRGLVYTVESSMVSYSDTGAWCVYFGCDHHHVSRCLRLVRIELDRLASKLLTPSQLSAAKRQLKGQIGVACDAREGFALSFGKSFLHYGWERDVERLYQSIDRVTSGDILSVAQEVFNPSELTTLIFR
ncbi:MAG: insulinase family protein [Prevotella sp.]|nr:insulinase family protein [Prevotella sp.]